MSSYASPSSSVRAWLSALATTLPAAADPEVAWIEVHGAVTHACPVCGGRELWFGGAFRPACTRCTPPGPGQRVQGVCSLAQSLCFRVGAATPSETEGHISVMCVDALRWADDFRGEPTEADAGAKTLVFALRSGALHVLSRATPDILEVAALSGAYDEIIELSELVEYVEHRGYRRKDNGRWLVRLAHVSSEPTELN